MICGWRDEGGECAVPMTGSIRSTFIVFKMLTIVMWQQVSTCCPPIFLEDQMLCLVINFIFGCR